MKRFIIAIIISFFCVGCAMSDRYTEMQAKYATLLKSDSISKTEYDFLVCGLKELQKMDSIKSDSLVLLKDSISKMNSPSMTEDQFIKLYKYESLYKYYRIVINNPSQKKFFWGWSKRTFEK